MGGILVIIAETQGAGKGGDAGAYNGAEVSPLDLKRNQITMAELLNNPRSRAVLEKRFGKWAKSPLVQAAGTLTLQQVLELTRAYVPKKDVEDTLQELRRL